MRTADSGIRGMPFTWLVLGGSYNVTGELDIWLMPRKYRSLELKEKQTAWGELYNQVILYYCVYKTNNEVAYVKMKYLYYIRYEYDDHYFLTDPREFIYEFFPLQSEWQLLKTPITLRDFEELPFVRSLFFRYGLYFPDSNTKAIMHTDQSGKFMLSDDNDSSGRYLKFFKLQERQLFE